MANDPADFRHLAGISMLSEAKGPGPAEIEAELRALRWATKVAGGKARSVSSQVENGRQLFILEPAARSRLDHYGDEDGWDRDAWREDYSGPLSSAVQSAMDHVFGKGALSVSEVDDKGFVYVAMKKPTAKTEAWDDEREVLVDLVQKLNANERHLWTLMEKLAGSGPWESHSASITHSVMGSRSGASLFLICNQIEAGIITMDRASFRIVPEKDGSMSVRAECSRTVRPQGRGTGTFDRDMTQKKVLNFKLKSLSDASSEKLLAPTAAFWKSVTGLAPKAESVEQTEAGCPHAPKGKICNFCHQMNKAKAFHKKQKDAEKAKLPKPNGDCLNCGRGPLPKGEHFCTGSCEDEYRLGDGDISSDESDLSFTGSVFMESFKKGDKVLVKIGKTTSEFAFDVVEVDPETKAVRVKHPKTGAISAVSSKSLKLAESDHAFDGSVFELAEGKALPPGTKRSWKGGEFVKQADGSWAPAEKSLKAAKSYDERPTGKVRGKDPYLKAVRKPNGLFVGSTPVRKPEELEREETLDTDEKLGDLKMDNGKARVWIDSHKIVTVQWPNKDGSTWTTVSRYREE